jgi:hypothetical protein
MPHLPLEDPSDRSSLVEQTITYVRSSPLLRAAFVVTVVDHVGAIALVALGLLHGEWAGFLALLSVLSWFFAVCMPVMNREVRARLGGERSTYWGEVFEMFFRVALCAITVLYTAFLIGSAI